MSAWTIDSMRFPIRIVHVWVDGRAFEMRDTWGRPIHSGPLERPPKGRDDPQWDRIAPEPCDDSLAPDGCRERWGHMGAHIPTPEMVRYYA